MRRFQGLDWARMGIFTTWYKIRANSVNWEAKVHISPAGAWIVKGRAVLWVTMETGNGMDPGVFLAKKCKISGSKKKFRNYRTFSR